MTFTAQGLLARHKMTPDDLATIAVCPHGTGKAHYCQYAVTDGSAIRCSWKSHNLPVIIPTHDWALGVCVMVLMTAAIPAIRRETQGMLGGGGNLSTKNTKGIK